MTNLKLVADEPTPLEKMLLDASRAELPSEAHQARLRAALGIGLPLSSPPSSLPPALGAPSGPAATAGTASSASGTSAATAGTRSVTFGKVVLGVAVAALVSAFLFTRHGAAPARAPARPATPPAPTAAAAPIAVREAEPVTVVSPLPAVAEATAPPRLPRMEASSAATADLSEQIRLIEAARASLAVHDAKAALLALDEYSAKFPRGSFGQEAMVLRIRAVDQTGDSARATALAKAFVARFPGSPHVARLKPIAERGASR